MKKTLRNLLLVALVLVALVAMAVCVSATEVTTVYEGWALNTDANADGTVNDIWYTLDSEGTLTFASKGGNSTELVTRDYNSWRSNPWISWKAEIKKIVFSSEITSLATYSAFNGCSNLVSVEFGAAKLTLADDGGAFSACPSLVTFGQTGKLQEKVFDLRNAETPEYTNTKNTFSGNADGETITVLLPYSSSKICFNKVWTNSYSADIQCWQTAEKVTMKLAQGSCYDTVPCTLKVTNTTTWGKDDKVYPNGVFGDSYWTDSRYVKEYYSDMELPLYEDTDTKKSEGFVQVKNSDNTTDNDGTQNKLRWRLNVAGTLTIYGEDEIFNINPATDWDKLENRPWASYASAVKKVVFETPNLTTIKNASYAFGNCSNLTTVVTPSQNFTMTGAKMFSGCSKLTTFGPEGTPANTFDIRNINSTSGANFFPSVPAVEITVLTPYVNTYDPSKVTNMNGSNPSAWTGTRPAFGVDWRNVVNATSTDYGFGSASKVTFKVVPGTGSEMLANQFAEANSKYIVKSYDPGEAVVTGTGTSAHEDWTCNWQYSLDLVTGVLDVELVSGNPSYRKVFKGGGLNTVASNYGSFVSRINFIGFDQFFEGWGGAIISSAFTNLTTVDIGEVNDFRLGAEGTTWFAAPNLATFGSSTRGTLKEGVIDLAGIGFRSEAFKLFNGASGAKELVINGNSMAAVTSTTFVGFENLEKITLGKVAVTDGAFDHMTALKAIYITDKNFADTADLVFPEADGLKLVCYSQATANSMSAYTKSQVIYFGDVIISGGFSIRTNKTGTSVNGLRTLYTFNEAKRDTLVGQGLIFKEFGAILVSKNKLGNGTVSLSWNGTEYVVNTAGAVKLPVFVGEEQIGKVLADQDGNVKTVEFAATLVNFKDNFTSDVYSCGYAIFVDTDGNEYIEYANYGDLDGKADWKFVNIFNLAMYYTRNNPQESIYDEEPVWGIIGTGSVTLDSANMLNEITLDGGVSYMMVATNAAGENVLYVRCADGSEPTAAQIEAAEDKLSSLGIASAQTVALMIKDDPDFSVKAGWQYELDAQIEAAGLSSKDKSFIYITDTHWELNNPEYAAHLKAGKFTTQVMKYVSTQLGDITVVHGGDLYGGYSGAFDANDPDKYIDRALEVTDAYITGQLKANFEGNFLYTMGNHDTNIVGYRDAQANYASYGVAKEDVMKYYLNSDQQTYEHTIAVVDASMQAAGKQIVYDTEGIELFKQILQNNGHTDEATLLEAEYMMKLHYYYDDTVRGIRYIVLDTGGCGRTQMGVYNNGWTAILPAQTLWLARTLKDTAQDHPDYDIAIIGHQTSYVHTSSDIAADAKDFGYNMRPLYNVISAFKTGTQTEILIDSTTTWAFGNYGAIYTDVYKANNDTSDATVKAALDFTGINFDETIFTMAGHEHADDAWYLNNNGGRTNVQFGSEESAADGGVLSILTGNASWYNTNSNADGVSMNSTYPYNFRFDIVTIHDDGSVTTTRIGAGQSRTFAYGK